MATSTGSHFERALYMYVSNVSRLSELINTRFSLFHAHLRPAIRIGITASLKSNIKAHIWMSSHVKSLISGHEAKCMKRGVRSVNFPKYFIHRIDWMKSTSIRTMLRVQFAMVWVGMDVKTTLHYNSKEKKFLLCSSTSWRKEEKCPRLWSIWSPVIYICRFKSSVVEP